MYIHVIHVITYTCIFCRTATHQVQKRVAEPSQYFLIGKLTLIPELDERNIGKEPTIFMRTICFPAMFPFDLSIESHCNVPSCFYHF